MNIFAASCGASERDYANARPAFVLERFGAVRLAIHHYSNLQCILAKANKVR